MEESKSSEQNTINTAKYSFTELCFKYIELTRFIDDNEFKNLMNEAVAGNTLALLDCISACYRKNDSLSVYAAQQNRIAKESVQELESIQAEVKRISNMNFCLEHSLQVTMRDLDYYKSARTSPAKKKLNNIKIGELYKQGKSFRSIAKELGCDAKTVKNRLAEAHLLNEKRK